MSDKTAEQTRLEQYSKAARLGALKEGLDVGIQKATAPAVKLVAPFVAKATNTNMADPVVRAGLEFAVMQTMAEVFMASAGIAHKIPGLDLDEDEAKARVLAMSGTIRGYSSERMTDEVVQYSIRFLPVIKKFFSEAALAGLFSKGKEQKALPSPDPDLWDRLKELEDEG